MNAPSPPTDTPASGPSLRPDRPTAEEVSAEAERVLGSRCLSNAPGQRQFLRYVVEETLAGRGHELKEYAIAIEVLGRPETFDPRMDAAVRVAARRLRKRLDDYYAGEGRFDPVVISLDRGGYQPEFARRPVEKNPETPPAGQDHSRSRFAGLSARWLLVAAVVLALVGGVAGLLRLWTSRSGGAPAGGTIAVLPFANASSDADTDYVCFGVVEDLTTALTSGDGLRVIARTSASQFGAQGLDLIDVGRKLGADLLIEGSVRREGGRLLVNAQLIETRKGTHLWAQAYERDAAGGIAEQQHVAQAIADAVKRRLGTRTARPSVLPRPVTAEALDFYWKGRYARARRSPDSLEQAVGYFERAVALAPDYADSQAALGDALATTAFSEVAPKPETVRRARACLRRALELDPESAFARSSLAWLQFFYDHDWPAAEADLRRSIEINPSSGQAHNLYALSLAAHGRFDEAVGHSREALRLDPVRYAASNDAAVVLWCARRYDEAIAACQRTLDAAPDHQSARMLRGMALLGKREYRQALTDLQAARQTLGPASALLGRIGHCHAVVGDAAAARAILEEMNRLLPKGDIAYVHLAEVYAGLGERAKAIECLERSAARHEADISFIGVDSALDGLRPEPRFQALLSQLGLTGR